MPHISLSSKPDGGIQLWYEITSPDGGKWINPEYQTLLTLPTLLGDTSMLYKVLSDERFKDRFNIVTIDPRYCGQSRAPPSDTWDFWQATADIALAMEKLKLPRVHLFAPMAHSCGIVGPAIDGLFPEKLNSVCIIGAHQQVELQPNIEAFTSIGMTWSTAEDLQEWEEATCGFVQLLCNDFGAAEDVDCIVEAIAARHPPTSAVDSFLLCIGDWQRKPIPVEALKTANIPLLIVQGDACEPFPLGAADEWLQSLPNARLHVVSGGSHGLALTHADECNAVATEHYLAHQLSLKERSKPVSSDFKAALKRLGMLYGIEVKKRDAKHPDSYTLVDKDHQAQIRQGIQQCLKLQRETPVRLPYGSRPLWEFGSHPVQLKYRFTERHLVSRDYSPREY